MSLPSMRVTCALVLFLFTLACASPAAAPALPAKPAEAPKPAAAQPAAQPTAAQPAAKPATQSQPAAQPAARQNFVMGTTDQSSSHYAYLATSSKIISGKAPEVNITLRGTGGSAENAELWVKNEIQMSLMSTDIAYLLYNGLDKYEGRAYKDLRYLWVYAVNPHVFVVRRDSNVQKVEDLDGKDFNPAARGSSSEVMIKRILEVLNIKPKYYTGTLEDALAAIKDKRIAGYAKAQVGTQVDATTLDLMTTIPVRLLPFSKAQLDKFLEKYPFYGFAEVPAGSYKDLEENKVGLMFPSLTTGVAASSKLSEETAYKIVKAIVEDNKPGGEGMQGTAMAALKGADLQKITLENAKAPLHAGAYKYFKEVGATIPEAAIPPEAKR